MKNNYILKGWFNMEEFKNGAISEEALDEIAGGLHMPPINLRKALIGAGVGILAATGVAAAATTAGIVISKKKGKGSGSSGGGTGKKIGGTTINVPDGVTLGDYGLHKAPNIDPKDFTNLSVNDRINAFVAADPKLKR